METDHMVVVHDDDDNEGDDLDVGYGTSSSASASAASSSSSSSSPSSSSEGEDDDDDDDDMSTPAGSSEDTSSDGLSIDEDDYEEGYDDDDDDSFDSVDRVASKDDSHFRYEVLTPQQIMSKPMAMIKEVNEILMIHPMIARQLLQHFKWHKETALQRYYDPEAQHKVFEEAHIPNPDSIVDVKSLPAVMECSICLDECEKANVDALPCGHVFCNSCWNDYLSVKITVEGTPRIKCAAVNCLLEMDEVSVCRLVRKAQTRALYMKLCAKAFVLEVKGMRWCPGTGCENAIKAEVSQPEMVECTCGTKFCFMCGLGAHKPTPCHMMRKWYQKQESEGESVKLLAKNTKSCPSCGALTHVCNKFNRTEKGTDRAEWNKYTFFYERWKGHYDARKYEQNLSRKADAIIKRLTAASMDWIDAQYIRTATEALREARVILAASYVFAYYMPDGVHVELFENYQGFLEESTEKLSQVLESKADEDLMERVQVINLTDNLRLRLRNYVDAMQDDAFKAVVPMQFEERVHSVDVEYTYVRK